MRNWFQTLNEALESESLVELWPLGTNIGYSETGRVLVEDSENYRLISIYRDETGRYERPVHYITGRIAIL